MANDPEQCQNQALEKLGYSATQVFVLGHLESVKWYGRLLGDQALRARLSGTEMPQARPYGVHTPLNRVIDFLLPESMAARRLGKALDTTSITHLKACIDGHGENKPWPEEGQAAIANLSQACDLMLAFLSDQISAQHCETQLIDLYQPQGEFIVAVIPYFLDHLKHATQSAT